MHSLPPHGRSQSVELPFNEQELKFYVPGALTWSLLSWLEKTLLPHPVYPSATIHSVYFDTATGRSFQEKAESYFHKTKYRLRWYCDGHGRPLDEPAFAEVKEKNGSARRKLRIAIPLSGSVVAKLSLDSVELEELFHRHLPRASAPAEKLIPMLDLRYERTRYVHPLFGDTFCLDKNIRCQRTHPGHLRPPSGKPLDFSVFEQKGASTDLLPPFRALPRFHLRKASVSKYYLITSQLLHSGTVV